MNEKKEIGFKSNIWKPICNNDIIFNKSVFNNYGFDKHIHEEFALGVIGQGSMVGFLDGTTKCINKTSIMTINPDTAHSNWSYKKNSYSQSAMYLKPSFLSTVLKENFNAKNIHFKTALLEDEKLANSFLHILNSYEKNELSHIDYECQLIDIINKILLKNTIVLEQKNLTKHDIAIDKAKEFIKDNLSFDLTLDDISSQLDISKYHFLRLFKEGTYFSPHTYVMLKRIEKAKQLLQEGLSLSAIANNCGFTDQSHLNKRFKTFVGITPGNYQKFFN